MENIKTYLNDIIQKGKTFKKDEFQDSIGKDFYGSGIKFFNNDSIAPFVFANRGASLSDILEKRCKEGLNGEIALDNYLEKKRYYGKNKENFQGLNYAYYFEGFEDVGFIIKTFSIFYKAVKGLNEVSENGSFNVSAVRAIKKPREFKAYEFLIEENLSQFEEVCPAKNPNDKNAICSIATIMLLRAIAQEGEEDEIDELAEQLIPFISFALKEQNRQMDDEKIYACALELARERLERLNEGLAREAFTAKLSNLKQDAKLFQEMRKSILDQNFADYYINFSDKGENKKFSFINKRGEFEECKVKDKKMDAYRYLDTEILLEDSVCDTDEEVLAIMFGNLLMLASSKDERTIENNKLAIAFALPLIQAANKLGNEKANQIIKETVARFNSSMKDDESRKLVIKEVLKPLEIDEEIFAQIQNAEVVATTAPAAPAAQETASVAEETASAAQEVVEKKSKVDVKRTRRQIIRNLNNSIKAVLKVRTFTISEGDKKKKVTLTPAKCETLRNVLGFLQDSRLEVGQKVQGQTATAYGEKAMEIVNLFGSDFLNERVQKYLEVAGGEGAELTSQQKKEKMEEAKISRRHVKAFARENVASINEKQ